MFFNTHIQNTRGNQKQMWKIIKMALNKNPTVATTEITASKFNEHFVSIGPHLASKFQSSSSVNTLPIHNTQTFHFTKVENDSVLKELHELPSNTNIDVLGFDSFLLNTSSDTIAPYLTRIINDSLNQSIMPSDLKYVKVTPIYKGKGQTNEPSNYRPISVLPHLAKILEKTVHKQLLSHITKFKLLSQSQSAFLKHNSTITSLLQTSSKWYTSIDKGNITVICFLDICKCFDCIDHSLLIEKLPQYGITGTELSWFESYLSSRKQTTKHNNTTSSFLNISTGVPQGSVLGPLLFLLFINDLCKLPLYSEIALFADDTCIYLSGPNIDSIITRLQSDLDTISNWFLRNKLTINTQKSFAVVIGTGQKLSNIVKPFPSLFLNKATLEYHSSAKYLGITIDSTLSWKEHIVDISTKIKPKLGALTRLSKILPLSQLSTIYMTTIQPYIDYGLIIWGHRSQQNLNVIQKFQNRAARLVTRNFDKTIRSSEIISTLKWHSVSQRLFYLTNIFMFKCINNIASEYFNEYFTLRYSIYPGTRNFDKLQLPQVRTETAHNSFHFQGPTLWNSLPSHIRSISDLQTFKNLLKTYSLNYKSN